MGLSVISLQKTFLLPPDQPVVKFTVSSVGVSAELITRSNNGSTVQKAINLSSIFFAAFDRAAPDKVIEICADQVRLEPLIECLKKGLTYKTTCTLIPDALKGEDFVKLVIDIDTDRQCTD